VRQLGLLGLKAADPALPKNRLQAPVWRDSGLIKHRIRRWRLCRKETGLNATFTCAAAKYRLILRGLGYGADRFGGG
jgi:hypothetical protein